MITFLLRYGKYPYYFYEYLKYLYLYWIYPEHCDVYITNYIRWHCNNELKYDELYGSFMPIGFLKKWCEFKLWYKMMFFDKNSLERILPNGKQDCIIVVHKGMVLLKIWKVIDKEKAIVFNHTITF